MYDTFRKTGTPAAGAATFSFTNPAMNTPLFSVLVAAKRTAADVTGSSSCGVNSTPIDPGGGVDVVSANATSWMTSNTVSTDIVNDPDASLTLMEAAAADPNAALAIDGSTLQAMNLSATAVSGDPVTASYAPVNNGTLNWIEQFTAASVAYAATLNPSDNARRYLLGTPRTVDQMEANTKSWGSANGHEFYTYQIEATFGRYGTLPIVVVSVAPEGTATAGFFLLVDGVNGMVDGPFVGGTVPAPATLLAGHLDAFQSGSEYKTVSAGTNCAALPVAVWYLALPPGVWVPVTPRPGNPGSPTTSAPCPPPANPTWTFCPPALNWPVPGYQSTWGCAYAAGTSTCTCTSYRVLTAPGVGYPITEAITCTTTGVNGCGSSAPGPTPNPNQSPTCRSDYWY